MMLLCESKIDTKSAASQLKFFIVLERFRSFNAENLGSVGQRTAKLPAIKLWRDLTAGELEFGPTSSSGAGAVWQTFL